MESITLEKSEMMMQFFCNHFVCISCWDRTHKDAPKGGFKNASAFVVSVKDVWYVVTAGHVLDQFDHLIKNGHKLENWILDDTMGTGPISHIPIPFPLPQKRQIRIVDDPDELDHHSKLGFDYGLIQLSASDRRLLEANKIVPLNEMAWHQGIPDSFDGFILAGVPEEDVLVASDDSQAISKSVGLLAIRQIKEAEIPCDITDQMPNALPRLYFSLPENGPMSVVGMSGGPIFGLKMGQDGRLRYWVVGVQSTVAKRHQISIACPIDIFLSWIADSI